MSKKRSTAKYGLAAVVTGLYGYAAYRAFAEPDMPKSPPERMVIAAGIMSGLTWLCAAL